MKKAFLAALLLGIGSAAGAQEAPSNREASTPLSLRRCLEIGLEQNYDVRIVRNDERISDNNATAGNAGMLPTVDLSAGYTGALDNDRTTTPRDGNASTENSVYDQTANVGLAVNWTLFDGFRIRTNFKRLKEMQEMGALKTRITIEDFMANLTAEYYNYIQQTLRLENFRYAVSLSRERLRITEARVQVGSFSRLDLLQARVDFNADSSKYMSQHELVTSSRIRINELLANENLAEKFVIPDSVIRVNATLDWNDLLAKTLSANASLLMAGHDSSLAELDLQLRGPGDMTGTQQSGLAFDLKIASLGKDGQILTLAREAAEKVLDDDPGLSKPENRQLRELSERYRPQKVMDFSMIS